jgi:hypothetical protein
MTKALPLLLALSSCVPVQRRPPGHETPHVPGIRIITRAQAAKRGLRARRFELRFGDNQDGTRLVLDYLDQAKRSGARYVSDIAIVIATTRGGRRVLCENRLVPFAKRHDYKVPHRVPARVEYRSVSKPVTRTVTEYQYRCHMVSKPVTRMETTYQYRYDYYSKTSRSVPVTRSVTRYEMQSECRSEPVTRTVTRYEHQLEAKYIPPRLEYLAAHYTDFNLLESRPVCRPAKQAPAKLPHRITGLVYDGGDAG